MILEESHAKAFPLNNMLSDILDSEIIGDTAKIVKAAINDEIPVSLIINNRAGGNALLIAQRIADRLYLE
jgi:hypothetical protein